MVAGSNSHSCTKYFLGVFLLMLIVKKLDQILEVVLTAVWSLILSYSFKKKSQLKV